MRQKDKWVFSLLITLIVAVAGFASFGMGVMGSRLPEITMPSLDEMGAAGEHSNAEISADFTQVSITPKTVQSLIETMERIPHFTRTVTTRMYYGEQVATWESTVWVDGTWTRVVTSQPNQTMGNQHTIIGENRVYRWYDHDRTVSQWTSSENTADLVQHIPSYRDVLELDMAQIADAGYVEKNGHDCIYVETFVDELNYWEQYWVSVETGLLVWAETYCEDRLVLQVETSGISQLELGEGGFTLPNGTVLHQF